ncbi:MAG: c-type cytochrome [Nitrospirota bacterium]|jgi:cbb3-type cytochrome oxidase cytochrome c subunit
MRKGRTSLWTVSILTLISLAMVLPGIAIAGESDIAAGKKIYSNSGCIACHTINSVGGKLGPDLTHIGSKENSAWLEEQVKDPKAHFPNSVMPAFKRMSKKELDQLVDYLDSLK